MAKFFIDRPVFAWVIAIFIMLAGILSIRVLPISQYPTIAPPQVVITATYPGASAKTLEDSVTSLIEQEMNGSDGLQYMESQSEGNGRAQITVTFVPGTSVDLAAVDVQNRIKRIESRLPQAVLQQGVQINKSSGNILMFVTLVSTDDSLDPVALGDYLSRNVINEIKRIPGVGDINLFGTEKAMRIWIDPVKMSGLKLSPADISNAIKGQNAQVASGSLAALPNTGKEPITANVVVTGQLTSPEEFGKVVLRANPDGSVVRLRDVAKIEMGGQSYDTTSRLDGKTGSSFGVMPTPTANALDTATAVRAKMEELSKYFPSGVKYVVPYDTSKFVKISIDEVVKTLLEAVVLVFLVMYLFLQNIRYTIIPTVVVPVALMGTFATMNAMGFSINVLTMFGMVLAIGILVDDAIVVVENVERHIASGKSPREAALAAMREVAGPIIAITSVLVAVFVPTAFLGGLTGQFYSQFALTIAISTLLSAFNSLTLSPAVAAVLLPPHGANPDRLSRAMNRWLGWLFAGFNRLFSRTTDRYGEGAQGVIRRPILMTAVYVALLALTVLSFRSVPTGFVPAQDKYYLVGIVQLPQGASLDRTEAVVKRMTALALEQPGVESVVAFPGLSINGFVNSPSAAVVFAMLDPFEAREGDELSAGAIAGALNMKFSALEEGFVAMFPPPPVPGLGNTGGFKLQVQDRAGLGYEALNDATQALMAAAAKDGRVAGVFTNYSVNVPQAVVDVDREKAKVNGVALASIYETLQVNLGSLYVNDFTLMGRAWQVNVQADAQFRMDTDSIGRLYARNSAGQPVPLSALADLRLTAGPDPVARYNGFASADISGAPAPGVGSGEAVQIMAELAREHLPPGFGYEWTELTYQQQRDGNASLWVFPLAVLLAFLILAAQYNSWSLPFAVILIVPMVLLSALAGVWIAGGENDLFTQIGFVVLVGLATKNAILIVEFARRREQEGVSAREAVLAAVRLRFRPILMTSLAFVMGVVPLVLASGAGAEMRQAMGVAVFAGMLGVTLFGLFLIPLFYVLLRRRASTTVVVAATVVSHA